MLRHEGRVVDVDGEERELSADEFALYDLIWKRTLASQMEDARGQTVSLRISATSSAGESAEFGASGTVITFRGFLAAYEESRDDEAEREEERPLPHLKPGDELRALELEPEGHATTPPSRYTEASLVQALEERGIGRPSTYASIITTILDRGYVFKRGTALVPSFLAFAVTGLLEQHFARLVDYDFTAKMEDDLDRIAAGDQERVDWLRHFYYGGTDGDAGLHALVADISEIDARAVNTLPLGEGIALRVGRYGPYVERGEERASVPEDMAPDELTVEKAQELLSAPTGDRALGTHPEWNRELTVRTGRYGPYVTETLEEGATEKPRAASLFKTMTPETVTLEEAIRLLSLPRTLGVDPADGEEITAQNGRYGPYVKKGAESRSLETEEQLFTITLEDALAVLAQPKQRRGRGEAKPPLRDLGTDPVSTKAVVLKEGRFGPYVTDGETNASLRRGDDPETVTIERAVELLADRRSRGPAPKKKRGNRRSAA